jgi:hypothetical protein
MMDLTTLAADLALLLAAAGSAAWALRTRPRVGDAQVLLGSWALACAFIAVAVLTQLLPNDAQNDLAVVRRMAQNLGVYIGLPFLGAALVGVGRRQFWSAAGWGRLMLGLFAFFELTRQMGYGVEYTQLMGAACTLAALYGAACFSRRARLSALAGSAVLGAGLALTSPMAIALEHDPATFRVLSALALVLFSVAIQRELLPRTANA